MILHPMRRYLPSRCAIQQQGLWSKRPPFLRMFIGETRKAMAFADQGKVLKLLQQYDTVFVFLSIHVYRPSRNKSLISSSCRMKYKSTHDAQQLLDGTGTRSLIYWLDQQDVVSMLLIQSCPKEAWCPHVKAGEKASYRHFTRPSSTF